MQSAFYSRAFTLAAIALLAVVCLKILAPFATSLSWAMLLAFLLHPSHIALKRRLGKRKQHATWLLTLAASLALLGPVAWLSTLFITQASSLLHLLQGRLNQDDLLRLTNQPWPQQALQWLDSTFGITITQLRGWATEATRELLQIAAATGSQVFLGAMGTAASLVMTLFLTYFFVRDGALMLNTLRELVPMQKQAREELFEHLSAVTRAVMYGTGLTALIQGTLMGFAFLFTGLPSPVVFGVLSVVLALLPVGGTALIWLPAALLLFTQDRWGAGIFMLVWGALLVSMIDNFIKPLLISGRAEVATLTVFLGVLGGIATFGAIGLFLGPVVLALALALIRFTVAQRHKQLTP
jgi:predicted PurR-regulated permease PerM